VTQFTLTDSYIHDALDQGHEIKSRAQTSIITNNRILDNGSVTSYLIDLPNGGHALVQGNTIEKGVNSVQNAVIDCGAEGAYTGSELTVTRNTVINDATHLASPTLMYNWCTTTVSANQLFGLSSLGENRVPTASLATLDNQVLSLASAPALDTSAPFLPQATPEPGAFGLVLTSLLAVATLRRRRFRSSSVTAGR
jgi:Right handed beta helix region